MGVVRRWERARAAAVIGECGTGKTLVALAAMHSRRGSHQTAGLNCGRVKVSVPYE
jgi:superfamily II DNA or RNA helicase